MEKAQIASIAHRHGFSPEPALVVWHGLQATGGGLVQFSHPELGGLGQWMPGMTMIGTMFDAQLKARVEGLCSDLAAMMSGRGEPAAPDRPPLSQSGDVMMEPMKPMKPMEPMKPMRGSDPWWPKDLGQPNSSGGQNDQRYAYFAEKRRLVIDRGGEIKVYDTGDHKISGVSQQQSGGRSGDMTFTSQDGDVSIKDLKVVSH